MRDQGLNELDISRLALGYWFKDDTVIPRTLNPSIAFSKHQEKRNPISRRPSYHRRQLSLRKRTRSMASAHGPMPTLRRMSRHDTDWNKVLPEEAADKRKSQRKW
ncbi:hypothetical protein BO71DRAFT_398178 [Aspergillus ellipticus CBS 707.79]|uniref:Uncharacterized protein n=1 Tax=Aspergillus ellipticus CBS 707.79 TaxID=1448320 RepID=A0A319DCZ9_9EURO|nr:hypothetical protein BO71DRAFT_398178 [Aspergillus ellipticus CBS 707.79]